MQASAPPAVQKSVPSPAVSIGSMPRWPGEPILGHLRAFRRDQVGMLRKMADAYPEIVELPVSFVRVVGVTSPALANEILVPKNASFAKTYSMTLFFRPVLGDGLLSAEGGSHEKQRRLLAPAFAPKRIAGYGATMAERAERFATALRDGHELDVADAMMRLTFEIVGKTLFDAELRADATGVGRALTTSMEIGVEQMWSTIPLPPMIPTPKNLRYRRAVRELDEVVYRIIRERRAVGGDRGDVLSTLLDARDDDGTPMSDKQIRDETMTLALAGHETTANALAWTFSLLARHPEARARMEAELSGIQGAAVTVDALKRLPYTLAILKESMRLHPPAFLLGRRAIEDVVIGSGARHRIRKGSIVLINVLGIHRRPDLWPEPDAFRPERFLEPRDAEKLLPRCTYMPFGAGPRVCIGSHFALLEAHLLLATIARRVRFDVLDPDPPRPEPLLTLRPGGGLRARVAVRSDA